MLLRSVLFSAATALLAWGLATPGQARAEELNWQTWQHLPVFDAGRMMPLDTFARGVVSRVCGRESPKLSLDRALPGEDLTKAEYAGARRLFPDGEARKFHPAELVFSWLVEPDHWDRVPFLVAEHHVLREEILGLPRADAEGRPLRYVSPYQVDSSEGLDVWREEIGRKMQEAEARGETFEFKGTDRKAAELVEALNCWRELTFSPQWIDRGRSRFLTELLGVRSTWGSMREAVEPFGLVGEDHGPRSAIERVEAEIDALRDLLRQDDPAVGEIEVRVARLRGAAADLAAWFEQHNALFAERPRDVEEESQKRELKLVNALTARARDLARESIDLQAAVFDNKTPPAPGEKLKIGGTLRLVPALNPFSLEENRPPEENPQPWLSLQALLLGGPETLEGYPASDVDRVRTAFRSVAGVYLDRENEDRAAAFDAAMQQLASDVRALGENVSALRERLPVRQMDQAALAATQYPPPGIMSAEVHYNEFQPFLWSWVTCLLAVVGFSLSFGAARKPMFWLGMLALVAAQFLIAYGFGLRTYITGWAPVTNMFETVIFVAMVVAGLGLWFSLTPLLWPGIRLAWRWTAAPLTWEMPEVDERDGEDPMAAAQAQSAASWLLLAPRAALMCVVFYAMTQVTYGEGEGYTAIALAPRVEAGSQPTANDLITWAVGLCLLAFSVWYVPRLALAALLSTFTVPKTLARSGLARPLEQVHDRKAFAVSGAALGLLAALAAYYAPVLDKSISPLRPVLRDNFWLTIHVLTITASYGAGALALGLGNMALFHYLFGRYRNPEAPGAEAVAQGHRPAGGVLMYQEIHRREPAACAPLAAYTYKAMQVAVLLLAAGTILGALWADVAWGRFWGWDAKEVWALISLLVYLVILHGRYAGLFGNFGLAAFSVVGATSIIMAWYGVNFVLSVGLHSYGRGTGGLPVVASFVLLDWVFVFSAGIRYLSERYVVEAKMPQATDHEPRQAHQPGSPNGDGRGVPDDELATRI